jgi:hypothetical protein
MATDQPADPKTSDQDNQKATKPPTSATRRPQGQRLGHPADQPKRDQTRTRNPRKGGRRPPKSSVTNSTDNQTDQYDKPKQNKINSKPHHTPKRSVYMI